MFTQHDPALPRRGSSVADLAAASVSIEVERRITGLRAEAAIRHEFSHPGAGLRLRVGRVLVHLGEMVSGVELPQQPAGQRAH